MSSLYASRWAATPPDEEPTLLEIETGLGASKLANEDAKLEAEVFSALDIDEKVQSADAAAIDRPIATQTAQATESTVVPELEQAAEMAQEAAEDLVVAQGRAQKVLVESNAEHTDAQDGVGDTWQTGHSNASRDETDREPDEVAQPEIVSEDITSLAEHKEQAATSEPSILPKLAVDESANGPTPPNDLVSTPISPVKTRLEAPRMRRKITWKGKNYVISIPSLDYNALGFVKPMNLGDFQARIAAFEEAGYSVRGFDLFEDDAGHKGTAHAKPIYPDDIDLQHVEARERVQVRLPDLRKWSAYTDWLTEQKLAALGVSIGGAEEPSSTSQGQGQDMSRQGSGQYPPLPFSPPLPTSSAGSVSRPGMIRGHSHTMSVASPISPLNGPFGHMHRHSTFSGSMGFSQLHQQSTPSSLSSFSPQSQGQQPQPFSFPGLHSFAPQTQFGAASLSRATSPALAQFAALRGEVGSSHSPGSPLSQQYVAQSPQDYSRSLMQDHVRYQHGYSQSVQLPSLSGKVLPQLMSVQQPPALTELPELPEEEDEEELLEKVAPVQQSEPASITESEPPAYVPPHKRAQLNEHIANPTPRGHRHNISEGLEREIESHERREVQSQDYGVAGEETSDSRDPTTDDAGHGQPQAKTAAGKAPLSQDISVKLSPHQHKKSGSRLNVAAPAFKFNPGASFVPSSAAFTFGALTSKTTAQQTSGHSRHHSSGSFNATAPSFMPAGLPSLPVADFSFSAPSLKPDAQAFEPQKPDAQSNVDQLTSIFGKVEIPEIVKPARRSKAITIVSPEDVAALSASASGTDQDDADGRILRKDDRLKRQRSHAPDGDEVPKFAEPTPVPQPADFMLKSQRMDNADEGPEYRNVDQDLDADEISKRATTVLEDANSHVARASSQPVVSPATSNIHRHKASSSLSALAKPFAPGILSDVQKVEGHESQDGLSSSGDLEDGEVEEHSDTARSPVRSPASSVAPHENHYDGVLPPSHSARVNDVASVDPSFDEIDAVMRQLNEEDVEEDTVAGAEISPLPSPGSHPMRGVTYLPEWPRSDAPSPSPRRQSIHFSRASESPIAPPEHIDSASTPPMSGWPYINRLNKDEDVPTEEWSEFLSPPDEEKLQHRSQFFDSRIDDIIGRVVEQRLQPLEESLRNIQTSVAKRPTSRDQPKQRRSSTIESDADDEDESDSQRHRPTSRGKDKRADHIKTIVLEALREQGSIPHSQSAFDLQELHTALADMKMSFARAASSGLELEDIRAVVDEAVAKQHQALVPVAHTADAKDSGHKRELSELEGRLNETLAGALEEANQRRAAEEREAEMRRMLRLAEEELQLMRETARDDDQRLHAVEHERHQLLSRLEVVELKFEQSNMERGAIGERLEQAEEERRRLKDKVNALEEESAAGHATLEEYRMSSHKWRQDIDVATREREDLENIVIGLERQLEDSQEAGSSMRRRLEKLHAGMATAVGQLTSEKAAWKAVEEEFRARCENLEAQRIAHVKDYSALEQELHILQNVNAEAKENPLAGEEVEAANSALRQAVRKLQSDLAEQQILAAGHERRAQDATQAGEDEVQRVRTAMAIELEHASHQINIVRGELEGELASVRNELESVKARAETAQAHHASLLEEKDAANIAELQVATQTARTALDDAHRKYETAIEELQAAHKRTLDNAVEDKQRAEYFLNEKLLLSDSKVQHFQDRVVHLEERLEVTKSAAQAATLSAQSKSALPTSRLQPATALPEKVSPQALRESILVLQEQLQEREARIEKLQTEVDKAGPAKLKQRDDEIAWLRELGAVRSEELTELINTLAQPVYDRAAVRDTAIRIRANLEMEQQEKDRFQQSAQSLPGQAIVSLSNFATPKAAQLTSAFNKWRANMESSSLRNAPRSNVRPRSYTPSKPAPSPALPQGYASGLMTPPASNLRATPSPEATGSVPAPLLHSRPGSRAGPKTDSARSAPASRQVSTSSGVPTTPLFRSQSYDQDAEDNQERMKGLEDDDLNIADNQPPAFRSLEAELDASEDVDEDL